ncbi:unnamed protein product, partial [Rotaria socialis]
LKTQDASAFPYCINHYQITLYSGSDYSQTRGKVSITLHGTLNTVTVVFDNDQTVFRSGSVETRLIPLTMDIGTVTSIDLSFSKTTNLLLQLFNSASWKFTKAVVLYGDNRNRRTFCPTQSIITSGSSTGFIAC